MELENTLLNQKLQAMLDKHEITELVHAYCNAADRHDHVKMRSLYHEDAYDDHGAFFKGLAMEFIDKLPEIQAPMEVLHHNVTTLNIRLDGNYAEGEVYIIAFHRFATEDGSADLLIGGRYFDQYEKRNNSWKFKLRAVDADWATFDSPSKLAMDHPFVSGANQGKPGPEDPSYQYYRLMTFGETYPFKR